MAGIYLHIPFCKQACHYCNFHFSTSLKFKTPMVNAICKELLLQMPYLAGASIETIYFGGGTPSLLSAKELDQIFECIHHNYTVTANEEITLEANPDDLTLEKLQQLSRSPINRLSIGVQSFFEADLRFMNRAHNAKEALNCIRNAQEQGFDNLTIDLIYGSPTTSDEHWLANLEQTFALQIPHISCYCLTVEPQTALDHFVKKGKVPPVDEEQAARHFDTLVEQMTSHGYDHYEISNFALPGHYSQHNSSYWLGKKYLGIGPSAHSFNGHSRQWNVAHNAKYLSALDQEKVPFEVEVLTSSQRYDEYVMTSLRTVWGCDTKHLAGIDRGYVDYFTQKVATYIKDGSVIENEGVYFLTQKGKLLADRIAMELFYEE